MRAGLCTECGAPALTACRGCSAMLCGDCRSAHSCSAKLG
ncbi:MAG TPA: hypothetical protein EYG25_03845 [Candidatus Poseidoniales archaeon]|uniref:B box-type domain-containing protein n=1 Tax=Marine Group III euryarchaeote TaxID=2173149 RepID=A0A7C8DL39_9ARCH|nr:hypothetical protein [Marine Group III euryarchaeote]HIL33401.1 hypothetical protein [Candidatus Poseidoniales archaeon]